MTLDVRKSISPLKKSSKRLLSRVFELKAKVSREIIASTKESSLSASVVSRPLFTVFVLLCKSADVRAGSRIKGAVKLDMELIGLQARGSAKRLMGKCWAGRHGRKDIFSQRNDIGIESDHGSTTIPQDV